MAQPKPKKPSKGAIHNAKTLRKILSDMHKTDKIVGANKFDCDALPYLKAIPEKKKIPRLYTAARAIDTLRKRLTLKLPPPHDKKPFPFVFDHFIRTKNHLDFVNSLFKDHKDVSPIKHRDQTREIYKTLLPFKQGRYILHEDTYKNKGCEYKITTSIDCDLKQFSKTAKKNYPEWPRNIIWDVYTTIKMDCSCKGKGKNNVKSATFEYSGKAYSVFSVSNSSVGFYANIESPITEEQTQYFLRVKDVVCCPENEPKTEDGSFMGPDENEDISFPNQFIEVGAGVATAKDEETELCASVGFMHNLLPGEENALFIGGRASIHSASFSGPDFSQTLINVGPAVEHQTFIGNTATKWFNGVNGAFIFGSQDSAGFKTDISGFKIGLYTGVEVPLGNQFALGVMATLLEYNNQTFKTDDSEFKTNSTSINLNKGSVGLSLRIDLDSN
jgi:hypothetical protein